MFPLPDPERLKKPFYRDFDKASKEIVKFLDNYSRSTILQDFFIDRFRSLFYGNVIDNFFSNLNRENIKKVGLPKGTLGKVREKYKKVRKEIRLAISLKFNKVDERYYHSFKDQIKKDFPELLKLIIEIEETINIKEAGKYLRNKEREMRKSGKPDDKDINSVFLTKALEVWIRKEHRLPDSDNLERIVKVLGKNVLPKFSKEVARSLKKTSDEMLISQRAIQEGFEYRNYIRWREPLDSFECLIRISLESVEGHVKKLAKTTNKTNGYRRDALIRIHARALQISNEILTLLKSGYADGANARWRSLHELAVIAFFLKDNNNEISERYLDHDVISRFKEAKDYKRFYKKLGYPPFGRKEFNKVKKEHDRLISKYGREFKYRTGYDWVPRNILPNPTFRALEEHVRLERLHPFYNLSCNAVHGGPRGFYRLGLMDNRQHELHLVGPSNYGLADPIQNAAISLMHATICLLSIESDFESIMQMHIMNDYVNKIGPAAVKVQKAIENEESSKP